MEERFGNMMAGAEDQTCHFCKKEIDMYDEEYFIESNSCYHMVHLKCFREQSLKHLMAGEQMECPECQAPVDENEMKSSLKDKDRMKVAHMEFQKSLDAQGRDTVKCRCGNQIKIEFGEVDYKVRGPDAKLLSAQMCEDMAIRKVKCNRCMATFCWRCGDRPYHTGLTCKQSMAQKDGKKCRFCSDVIDESKST